MPLFSNSLSKEEPNVYFMRSLITLAGPLNTGYKRHRDIKDDRTTQNEMVTDY